GGGGLRDLVEQVPGAVERVAEDEEHGQAETEQGERDEEGDGPGLGPEGRLVAEVGEEREVHGGDRDEQESEEGLLKPRGEARAGERDRPDGGNDADDEVLEKDGGERDRHGVSIEGHG